MAFKVGDTIYLKSGGLKVTVTEVLKNDVYRCEANVPGDALQKTPGKTRRKVRYLYQSGKGL